MVDQILSINLIVVEGSISRNRNGCYGRVAIKLVMRASIWKG